MILMITITEIQASTDVFVKSETNKEKSQHQRLFIIYNILGYYILLNAIYFYHSTPTIVVSFKLYIIRKIIYINKYLPFHLMLPFKAVLNISHFHSQAECNLSLRKSFITFEDWEDSINLTPIKSTSSPILKTYDSSSMITNKRKQVSNVNL